MSTCPGCDEPIEYEGDVYVCEYCDEVFCAACADDGVIRYVDGKGWMCVECRQEEGVEDEGQE